VEAFHKNLKANVGLAKLPTQGVRTQSNPVFMAIYATFQLECLHLTHKMNRFALRSDLYGSSASLEGMGKTQSRDCLCVTSVINIIMG
jgi:hypothetical protein